jgi:hypothetical protein
MNNGQYKRSKSWAESLFAMILRLYPERFRHEYGEAMQQVLGEMIQDPEIGTGQLYRYLVADVSGSLLPEHFAGLRAGDMKLKAYTYGILLGIPLCLAVVATNVLNPGFNYFGLNETLAWALSALVLLGFFALSGYLASGPAGNLSAGARTGLLTALISIGIVMLTFFITDNVFFDIVSKQPDKIVGFGLSHMTSMRDYINMGHLRAATMVLPVFCVVGLLCGVLGAFTRRLQLSWPLAAKS